MSNASRRTLKRTMLGLSGCTLLLVTIMVSCSRDVALFGNVEQAPFPKAFNFDCAYSPAYEDTLLCVKWRGPNLDYIARPNRVQKGKYYAWPEGLNIDVNTGAINVTRSEAGLQYIIGFVKEGTTDTCHSRIVVSGVHYKDDIYVLGNNDTLAIPYFNANPIVQTVCDASADDDYPGAGNPNGGNTRCEFDDDEDDDNANGPFDEPPAGLQANEQFVRVRSKSGIINLKKTLQDGAFGQNPQNGATKEVIIFYRLNDCSMKALRQIKVRLMYYEKKSDIPQQIKNEIALKKSKFEGYGPICVPGSSAPRPPMIVLTRTE